MCIKGLFTSILLISLMNANCQQADEFSYAGNFYSRLKIGDKLPNIVLRNVKNYPTTTIKPSNFSGKLLILDFWNRYCEPCLRAFPEMQELQNKFHDKVQVLLVTSDLPNYLSKFFETSSLIKSIHIPFVLGDTILNEFFPHIGVPFHVWIDENGIVKEMTEGWNTTAENVQAYLDGKSVQLPERYEASNEAILQLPELEQLFKGGEKQKAQLREYSLLMKRSQLESRTGSTIGLYDSIVRFLNFSIPGLFNSAYMTHPFRGLYMKTIVEVKDSSNINEYYPPSGCDYGNWIENNTYCYETRLPSNFLKLSVNGYDSAVTSRTIRDLEKYFNVSSHIEERQMKTLILYSTGPLTPHSNTTDSAYYVTADSVAVIRNKPIRGVFGPICRIVLKYYSKYLTPNEIPFINEVMSEVKIDADLKIYADIPLFDAELRKYGLGLKEEVRPTKCLIIKEL